MQHSIVINTLYYFNIHQLYFRAPQQQCVLLKENRNIFDGLIFRCPFSQIVEILLKWCNFVIINYFLSLSLSRALSLDIIELKVRLCLSCHVMSCQASFYLPWEPCSNRWEWNEILNSFVVKMTNQFIFVQSNSRKLFFCKFFTGSTEAHLIRYSTVKSKEDIWKNLRIFRSICQSNMIRTVDILCSGYISVRIQ